MSVLEAIIYGFIQGISEFLPISSSGHLALLPEIMHIQDPGVLFDIMMHLGTALAVIYYFREDILKYFKALLPAITQWDKGSEDIYFVRNFIFSTVVSVIFILLLIPISKHTRSENFIVFNLSFFGAILWLADILNRKKTTFKKSPFLENLDFKYAGLIGLAQALAIFPGVSRSGITLTVALMLSFNRKDASSYSFLLSIPIIFGGIIQGIPKLSNQSMDSLIVMLTGVAVSFVVGYLTIRFFMRIIAETKLVYFSIYRWIVAAIMLWIL